MFKLGAMTSAKINISSYVQPSGNLNRSNANGSPAVNWPHDQNHEIVAQESNRRK